MLRNLVAVIAAVVAFLFIAPTFLFWLIADSLAGGASEKPPFDDQDPWWKVVLSGLSVYAFIAVTAAAFFLHDGVWVACMLTLCALLCLVRFLPVKSKAATPGRQPTSMHPPMGM